MTSVLKGVRALAGYCALYAGLALLALMLLVVTAICLAVVAPLPADTRRRVGRRIAAATFRWYLRALTAFGLLEVDLGEIDRLRDERALVIAPNHPCLLDAVLVISRLPDVACIMKAGLSDNFFLGAGARIAGYIRNDAPRSMVRLAVENLRRGGHLLVFPEGTRTVRAPVNPLGGAFALIARKAAVPVQVVIIETDSPFLGKGWPLWRRPEFPLRYRVRLGPRIDAGGSTAETVARVANCFERELGAGQREARPVFGATGAPIDA